MPSRSAAEVLEELQPIFEQALDAPGLKVTLRSSAKNIANWDSVAHIEIIELVERRFCVKFALGELQGLREVSDLVSLLLEKTT